MKKIAFLFILVNISLLSFAQFNVGGHFAYNSTWLMNKQVFDAGAEMDVAASFGSSFGIIAGYYFSDQFGLETNINFNKLKQNYEGSIKYFFTLNDERNAYTATTVLNTLDIPVLMKFGKNTYFEFGPMFQFVNKATYTRTFDETDVLNPGTYHGMAYSFANREDIAVKSNFKNVGIGVAFGFGANFNIIEDALKLNFGVRFNYILTDMQGINGLGEIKDSNFVTADEKDNFKTNPLYGGLKIGLIYIFN